MAVVFSTLFARLGRLMDFGKAVRASQTTLRTEYEDTMSNYTDADMDMVRTLTNNIERRIDEAGKIFADLVAGGNQTLTEMMDDDFAVVKMNVESSTRELIRQMITGSQTIHRPDAGFVTLPTDNKGTAGPGGGGASVNSGNGIMLANDLMPLQGFTSSSTLFIDWPSIRTETFRSICFRDATSPNVKEGQESFLIEGQRSVPRSDEDWPKGSGTRGSVLVASPSIDAGRTPMMNVCTNSDFQDFTSNVPDKWTLVTGTAGTHVYASGASGYGPTSTTNSLRFVGDGSTNPNIKQVLRTTSGTLGEINPDVPYSITAAIKYATTAPTADLIITVRDSGGTILNDGDTTGRLMKLLVSSGDIGTSYAIFSTTAFSPMAIDKGAYIDIRFTTNVANTSQVFVSDLVVAQMKTFQKGGLAFQMIGGSTRYSEGDQFTLAATNNIAAADGELALETDRFFGIGQNFGLALPSGTSPSISDGVIS